MAVTHHASDMYPVHRVPITRPFIWLSEGWDSMMHHRSASLAYGVIVAAMGALILAYDRHPLYIAASIAAFLIVGPVITAGVCELSRSRDHGDRSDFQSSLRALNRNRAHLVSFAEVLAIIALAGFALAAVFLYIGTGTIAPPVETTVWGDVLRQLSGAQIGTYALTFGIVAGIVFVLSVVTVPMIIDRHVDANTAMQMSLKVALKDFPAMIVWAVLIVGLVVLGFATALLGIVFVMPLLGHATWCAYRDTVEEA